MTMDILNNQIYQYNNHGVTLQAGAGIDSTGNFNINFTGNTVGNRGNNPAFNDILFTFRGLELNSGVSPGDNYTTCLNLGNNTLANSGGAGGVDVRLRQRQQTTVILPGYAGAEDDIAAVQAYVLSLLGGAPSINITHSPAGGGYINGGACPTS